MLHTELVFDPANPYPLFPLGSYRYEAAKIHSERVDSWLGFQTRNIEAHLQAHYSKSEHQTWCEISVQSFQTPYCELRSLLSHLEAHRFETVVDLGCAYARLAFILGKHYPTTHFIGFELCEERVAHALDRLHQWDFPPFTLKVQNLEAPDFRPPLADCYFLYDYGTIRAIQKTLQDLKTLSREKPLTVVARGRASRHFIQTQHPWLSQVKTPEHFDTFSIFYS